MVAVGQKAPDFTLKDQDGNDFQLSSVIGKKNIVLYFYPSDFTAGCTAEACSFRDNIGKFDNLDAIVIGISSDNEETHQKFKQHHKLPFTLLADPNNQTAGLYGCSRSFFGLVPPRKTFVINKEGVVVKTYDSLIFPTSHVTGNMSVYYRPITRCRRSEGPRAAK